MWGIEVVRWCGLCIRMQGILGKFLKKMGDHYLKRIFLEGHIVKLNFVIFLIMDSAVLEDVW